MSDTISFGVWLRQQRKSRDLTQLELAKLVGCAVGTLRNIEADDARPSKQLAARLARELGVAEQDVAAVIAFARGSAYAPKWQHASHSDPEPPLHSAPLQMRYTNLPAQLTGLIGRTHEVDAVCALLRRMDVRLVTLTGPGGTGKTRVAVASALQLVNTFRDGIAFVDLAAVTDSKFVLPTIAQSIGVIDTGRQPLRLLIAAALRDQELLLLLDNFEQVIAAGSDVAALLTASLHLKVLTTSRTALGLAGEYEWPVPPLALPDRAHLPPFEQLSQYEAVRLFSERARAANPTFVITTSNAPAVAEICYQLDGLPLAIELVAAWVKLFEPQALLARLDKRLTFLAGGRDRPTRQQTMWNTIAWSYQLLTFTQQVLFQRLSVFVGGGTLAAIEAVCGDQASSGDVDMIDGLAALVSQSLLRTLPETPDDTQAEPRFGMLETIRAFALERLADSSGAESIRQRHAHYFKALAERAAAQWSTSTVDAWIEQLHREHDNMRAALQWARDSGHGMLGLQIAGALWKFWQGYGYTSEGRTWLDHLLTLDDPHPDRATMVARLCGLQAAAWLASDQRDDAHATKLLEQSMLLRQQLRETTGQTNPLVNAARQARTEGQYGQATAALTSALSRHDALRMRIRAGSADLGLSLYDLGLVLRVLGLVLREQGDFAQATALFEESLSMQRRFGDREGVALALLALADVARDQGDAAGAREYGEESLAILRDLRIQWALGFVLNTLALASYVDGGLRQAQTLIDESITLFRDINAYSSLGEVLITQGYILRAQGNATAAWEAMTEALRYTWAVGPRLFVAGALEGLAVLESGRKEVLRATQLLAGASALRVQMGAPVRPIDQDNVADTLITARAALGEDYFAAVWSESATLPLELLLKAMPAAWDLDQAPSS